MPERAVYFLPGVRFADYWIAFREEIEIEEEALSARARQDEFSRRIALEAAEALRNLDALPSLAAMKTSVSASGL